MACLILQYASNIIMAHRNWRHKTIKLVAAKLLEQEQKKEKQDNLKVRTYQCKTGLRMCCAVHTHPTSALETFKNSSILHLCSFLLLQI